MKATAKTSPFALLFEFEGDATNTRHVLYNCTATRPSIEGSTTEEEIEPDTETLTISAAALANGYVKARSGGETPEEILNAWYEKVYTPSDAQVVKAAAGTPVATTAGEKTTKPTGLLTICGRTC